MSGTRQSLVLVLGVVLLACAQETPPEEELPADTVAAAPTISLADVAGTWHVRVMPATSDSVVLEYDLTATADGSDWTIQYPDREELVPVRIVAVEGDSIRTASGPFGSVLRPGVQVTTEGVFRLVGDMLVGETVAHWQTADADSVATLRQEGTRTP